MDKASDSFREFLIEELKDPEEAMAFLEVVLEEHQRDGNARTLLNALGIIAEAQGGLGKLAKRSKLNRQNLYKVFSSKSEPRFFTVMSIINALGFRIEIRPFSA